MLGKKECAGRQRPLDAKDNLKPDGKPDTVLQVSADSKLIGKFRLMANLG